MGREVFFFKAGTWEDHNITLHNTSESADAGLSWQHWLNKVFLAPLLLSLL